MDFLGRLWGVRKRGRFGRTITSCPKESAKIPVFRRTSPVGSGREFSNLRIPVPGIDFNVWTLKPELWFQVMSISMSSCVITPCSNNTANKLALKISAITVVVIFAG